MFFSRRSVIAPILAVLLTVALASIASAHALYASSTPAANSTVTSVPSTVKVLFEEGVNPKGSSLTVVGSSGAGVDQGDGHVDLNDPDRKTMLVSLKSGLGSGSYTVNWTTVSSDDGDKASGSFKFTVASSSAAASAASSTVQPKATTLPKTGGPPLGAIGVLALGLLASGVVLRRGTR